MEWYRLGSGYDAIHTCRFGEIVNEEADRNAVESLFRRFDPRLHRRKGDEEGREDGDDNVEIHSGERLISQGRFQTRSRPVGSLSAGFAFSFGGLRRPQGEGLWFAPPLRNTTQAINHVANWQRENNWFFRSCRTLPFAL